MSPITKVLPAFYIAKFALLLKPSSEAWTNTNFGKHCVVFCELVPGDWCHWSAVCSLTAIALCSLHGTELVLHSVLRSFK